MENKIAGVQPTVYQNVQTCENKDIKNQEEIKVFEQGGKKEGDTVEFSTKEEKVSGGNKFLSGAASFFIPGLGQLINGEGKKGLKHFLKHFGLETGAIGLSTVSMSLAGKTGNKAGKIAAGVGAAACGVGAVVNWISSIVDASKNAKNK